MTTNKVAAYIRVSDPKQAERESHQTQIDEMKPAAQERGYVDIVWFREPGISGEEISNRKKFQELLTRSQNGEFKVWFVYRVNRIGRFKNPLDRYLVQEIIVKHGITVHSLNEGVLNPAENDDDVFKLEELLSAARKSNIVLSEDVRKGQNRVRRAGRYAAGGIPFFVDWNPVTKKCKLNERRYETFCEVLRLLQRELGLHRTVNILNANLDKYPPMKAKKWSTGTISGWFHPKRKDLFPKDIKYQFYYTGIHWQNIMDRDGNPKPESEWVPVDIGAQIGRQHLFQKEVIDEVIIKMKSRRKRREEGEEGLFNPDDFLLENLVECAICGKNLGIHAWKEKKTQKVYRYYKCSNRDKGNCSFRFVPADQLDINVLVRFLENVSDPEKLQQAIIQEELLPKSRRRDVESILSKAVQDREELLDSLDRLEIARAARKIREESYQRQRDEWKKALAEAQSTIRRAEHTLSRPDDFMRAAKAASEWFAERVLLFKDITPGKKPWGEGESAEKSLVNIHNLEPEERRLTFSQMRTILLKLVAAAGKIQVWNKEKFIIPGILPVPVTGNESFLISSDVSIRGK